MKKILIYIFVCFTGVLHAQVTEEWATLYDHEAHTSGPREMAIDNSGNVYITGYTYDSVFTSSTDYLTIRYSSSGNIIWAKKYGVNTETDNTNSICIDADSNVYITGITNANLATHSTTTLKYDANGNLDWVQNFGLLGVDNIIDLNCNLTILDDTFGIGLIRNDCIGTFLWDSINANNLIAPRMMLRDSLNNIYALCESSSNLPSNDDQYSVRKFSSNGNFLWEALYNPTSGYDQPAHMVLDDSANIYITGGINTSAFGGFGTVKFDSSGVFQWGTTFNLVGLGESVAIDAYGNTYSAGFINTGSTYKYYVVKYDIGGNQVWALPYDTANGNLFVKIIYSNNYLYMTCRKKIGVSRSNIATIKLDTAGTEIWRMEYAGPNTSCYPVDLKADSLNNIYITGFRSNIGFGGIVTIKYSQITGIDEYSVLSNNISVYPNPFSSNATLRIKSYKSQLNYSLGIYNLLGEKVREQNKITQQEVVIEKGNLLPGIYFLKVVQNNGTLIGVKKILIQ